MAYPDPKAGRHPGSFWSLIVGHDRVSGLGFSSGSCFFDSFLKEKAGCGGGGRGEGFRKLGGFQTSLWCLAVLGC